ncbi:hypothetical protein thsrh120_58380 [Rhizobium sp. No.120]
MYELVRKVNMKRSFASRLELLAELKRLGVNSDLCERWTSQKGKNGVDYQRLVPFFQFH